MDIIIILVIGGVIGWLASILMGTNSQMGILANVVVGIVGSWLGHWLAPQLHIAPAGEIGQWLISIGGAALLILLLKIIGAFR